MIINLNFFLHLLDLHYLYGVRREGRLHLNNKNKFEFILYCLRFALPLHIIK